ncbi:MAG: ribonuclease HI family protein [Candidatus Niyogibacteria bacterium]|nr:ribonuclease HI family protein [Candidatus Niyogibacteria bacterium]
MEHTKNKINIYTDGGARGNPGPAALGAVFCDAEGRLLKEYGEYLGVKTNNEAEYEAIIFALKKAKQLLGKKNAKDTEIILHTDSELVERQLNGKYKIEDEKLQPLFMKIWNLRVELGAVSFRHVARDKNKDADRMVNEALDRESGGGGMFE